MVAAKLKAPEILGWRAAIHGQCNKHMGTKQQPQATISDQLPSLHLTKANAIEKHLA